MHVLADRLQPREHGPGPIDVIDAPPPVPGPVSLLVLPQKAQRPHGRRVFHVEPQRPEHLQFAPREVGRARIQQGPVVGEGNLVQEHFVVVFVVGAPPAVAPLHG